MVGIVIKESWTGNRPASQPEITVRKGWLSSKSQRLMALRQFSESEMGSVRSPTVLTGLSNGIGVKSLQQRLKRNGLVGCKWRTKRVFTHCRTQRSGAIEATRMGLKVWSGRMLEALLLGAIFHQNLPRQRRFWRKCLRVSIVWLVDWKFCWNCEHR